MFVFSLRCYFSGNTDPQYEYTLQLPKTTSLPTQIKGTISNIAPHTLLCVTGRDQVEEQFLSPLVEVSSPEEQEESLPEEQKQVLFVEQNLPDVTRTTSGEEQVTHGEGK